MDDTEFKSLMNSIAELSKDDSSTSDEIHAMCMTYFEEYMCKKDSIHIENLMLLLNNLSPEFRATFEENNIRTVSQVFLENHPEIAALLQESDNLIKEQQFINNKFSIPGAKDATNTISMHIFPQTFPFAVIQKSLSYRELLSFDEAYTIFKFLFLKLLKDEAYEDLNKFCWGSEQNRIFCQNMYLETRDYLTRTNFYSKYLKIQCKISGLHSSQHISGLPWCDKTIVEVLVFNKWISVLSE